MTGSHYQQDAGENLFSARNGSATLDPVDAMTIIRKTMTEKIKKRRTPKKQQPRINLRFWLQCAVVLLICLLPVGAWLWFSQPHSAEGYYQRAMTENGQGKRQEAIIDLKLGLKLDPQHINARILLGELQLQQGAVQSAEKEARTLLQLDSGNKRAQSLLRNVTLAQQGILTEGQKVRFEELKAQEQVDLLVALGNGLLNQNRPESAVEQFEDALKINPDSRAAYLGLARVALLHGDDQQFSDHLTRLLALTQSQKIGQQSDPQTNR